MGDHASAARIMLRSQQRVYLDFEAIETLSRKKVKGKALILKQNSSSSFIIGYNNNVYTIANKGDVDLLSTKEHIDYTDEKDERLTSVYSADSFQQLLSALPPGSYLKGEIIIPENYKLADNSWLPDRCRISGQTLIVD